MLMGVVAGLEKNRSALVLIKPARALGDASEEGLAELAVVKSTNSRRPRSFTSG
jgi:hypothetical protein